MEIPQNISFKKVGKKGGRLTVNFTSENIPDYIWIKGTEDLTRVRKNKKTWLSRFKYNSLAVTLNPIDNVAGILEQTYSENGKAVLNTPNKVSVASFTHDVSSNQVTLTWSFSEQINLREIAILRQDDPNADYVELKRFPLSDTYTYVETVKSGNYNYEILAYFEDGTTSIVWIENVIV